MRNDQIVRVVTSLSVALMYSSHVAFNGSGPIPVPLMANQSPLVVGVATQLMLAFPELLDRLPYGPNREDTKA